MFKKKNTIPNIEIKKKVHLLVLDQKWHELFKNGKTKKMQFLEKKLNNLIKKQGQNNNDLKEYSLLKQKLMNDIINNMDLANENPSDSSQIMEKNKKYIEDINAKLEELQQELYELPDKINNVNKELVNVSMAECYKRMIKDKEAIEKMDENILKLRNQLNELLVLKNEKQEEYDNLYFYMHDVIGAEIIEQFDEYYLKK